MPVAILDPDFTAYDFLGARRAMVESQLRPSGVNDPWVLAAMGQAKRENFVPEGARAAAYMDRAVPLGDGRFLSAPLVHARLLAEAAPQPTDAALVVSNSGYLAALLGPLVGRLVEVAPAAVGAGLSGGPFTLIIVDGAAEELPVALTGALAANGRIVIGTVARGITRLAAGRKSTKNDGALALLALAEIGMPVLPEFAAKPAWRF